MERKKIEEKANELFKKNLLTTDSIPSLIEIAEWAENRMIKRATEYLKKRCTVFHPVDNQKCLINVSEFVNAMKQEDENIGYSLVGVDGNAYSIMAYVSNAMKECGCDELEVKDYLNRAKSSDYNNLLAESFEQLEKVNDDCKLYAGVKNKLMERYDDYDTFLLSDFDESLDLIEEVATIMGVKSNNFEVLIKFRKIAKSAWV